MRKKLKKVLATIICFVIIAGMAMPVSASSSTNDEQINTLFDDMAENIALSLLKDGSTDAEDFRIKAAEIEKNLLELGVEKLSEEELSEFFAQKGIPSPKVSKPSDTNTVHWYLYTDRNQAYGSSKYDVQRLVAVGNNAGGMLVTGKDNDKFYSGENKTVKGISTAVSIYVQKAIGSVPIIKWTPYELLFSSSSSNVFNSSYITHRCVSSIEFSYVKKSSLSDDKFKLCKFSNKLSIASNAHGAAVVNSVPKTYSSDKSYTVSSDKYSSLTNAVEAYVNNVTNYDYISSYKLDSYDGKYSKTASVPNPVAGPGQIY